MGHRGCAGWSGSNARGRREEVRASGRIGGECRENGGPPLEDSRGVAEALGGSVCGWRDESERQRVGDVYRIYRGDGCAVAMVNLRV